MSVLGEMVEAEDVAYCQTYYVKLGELVYRGRVVGMRSTLGFGHECVHSIDLDTLSLFENGEWTKIHRQTFEIGKGASFYALVT